MSLSTQKNSELPESLRFADFVLDLRTEELWRDGRRVRLPRQSFQVLAILARAPGQLVTREALQATLWPATSQVEWEQGLNAVVNRLREALRDSAADPKFIETLPRRGYRFIGRIEAPPVATDQEIAQPAPNLSESTADPSAVVEPEVAAEPRGGSRRRSVRTALLVAIIAVTVIAIAMIRRPTPSPPTTQTVRSQPFTALPGEERDPAFSPDGSRIVFAWDGGKGNGTGFDLYVKTLGSEKLLRLTQTPARSLDPAWSPDGATIAFTRDVAGNSGLFLVSASGGGERRLAPAAFARAPFMKPAWAPDGTRIAYSSYTERGSQSLQLIDVRTLAIAALPTPKECWNIGMPTFSDDESRIAFVCTTSVGVFDVYVTSPRGTAPKKVATVMGEPEGMTWDADQSSLIVARDMGDGGGLWRLRDDGSLVRLPFGEEASAPTRHGKRIAYARGRQAMEIWRMDLAAADPMASAERLVYSTRVEMTPSYSADHARIVFASNRSGSSEIWVSNADGREPVQLTHLQGPLAGAPSFCDDGRRVAFDARIGGRSRLYVLDIDERVPRPVDSANVELNLPAWSADCKWLFASDGRTHLVKLPAAGGTPQRFTAQGSYLAQVAGDRVVFNSTRPDGVMLAIKAVAGGEETPLSAIPLLNYDDAWAATPLGVFFTTGAPSAATLHFYDFVQARVRRIGMLSRALAPGGGLGLAASRDGRWLLYTQSADTQRDIMIVDIDVKR
jgi:Tol biopolymer transport system component/DNA-binding winged helix-turn-helix (wHTH) protein